MAVVGAVLLVGGAAVVVGAANPFHAGTDLSASAATLPPPTTLVIKTSTRSLARVLPVQAPSPPAEAPAVNLVSLAAPSPTPASAEAHAMPVVAPPPAPSRGLILSVPHGVRIKSPTSFAIGSTVYRLSDTEAVGVRACSTRRAGRCFRRPRGDLKMAIAGATLSCRTLGARDGETLVDCVRSRSARL